MFPQWADHASGMLQNYVWTAVELEGLGANLQHMNMFPPAEEALKKEFNATTAAIQGSGWGWLVSHTSVILRQPIDGSHYRA